MTYYGKSLRRNSNITGWHFIEGKLNVADDCLRVIKCKDFTSNSRYLKEPEFLREFSLKEVLQTYEFVRQNEPTEIISNTSKLQQTDNQFSSITLWERFSSFQKLIKVILAAINIAKYCKLSYSVNITVNDIQDATSLILKYVQQERYRIESTTKNNKKAKTYSVTANFKEGFNMRRWET